MLIIIVPFLGIMAEPHECLLLSGIGTHALENQGIKDPHNKVHYGIKVACVLQASILIFKKHCWLCVATIFFGGFPERGGGLK